MTLFGTNHVHHMERFCLKSFKNRIVGIGSGPNWLESHCDLIPIYLLFMNRYFFNVSLLSGYMSRYFATSRLEIWMLFNVSGFLKVPCTDLASFILIRHFLNRVWMWLRFVCSSCEATCGFSWEVRIVVLSVKVAVVTLPVVGSQSAVKRGYRRGSRALLWGLSALIG